MPRVLVLGDDERAVKALAAEFAGANYVTSACAIDVEAFEEGVAKGLPDIVVADLRPENASHIILKELLESSEEWKALPLIVLLRDSHLQELLSILSVDDFALEPVRLPELMARVKLVLMRRHKLDADNVVRLDGLVVDLENYEVSLDGEPLDLTYKEYELLRFLVTHRGRVFTRDALLNHVWGYDYFGGSRTVDVHIRRIRAKLGSYEALIETVRNVGYRFGQ